MGRGGGGEGEEGGRKGEEGDRETLGKEEKRIDRQVIAFKRPLNLIGHIRADRQTETELRETERQTNRVKEVLKTPKQNLHNRINQCKIINNA